MRTYQLEKRTSTIDVVYLTLSGIVALVAVYAIFFAGPDSWFHTQKNHSLALLFFGLGVLGVLDLTNAANHGKVWVKLTPLYRVEHPRVFALHKGMDTFMLLGCIVGIIALLFFLPPL